MYWFSVRNAPAGRHAADELAVVADLFRGWADPVPELIATTPAGKLVHNDITDRPPTRVWSRGRVVVIGDPAHPTTPNFGQGGCMAIEDAVALARAMSRQPDPAEAFKAFTAERYRRTTGIVTESWRFGRVGQLEGRLACRVRDALFGLILPLIGSRSLPKHASFNVGPLPG